MIDQNEQALKKHEEWRGKLRIETKAPITNREELAIAYTPGVAEPCLRIAEDEALAYRYTGKGNTVAVITDGSAVLGLGNIGPAAAMPVMEGKCALFKTFADIDAIPILVDGEDTDTIVETIFRITKSFGGINLEDIASPRCFEIERRLDERCPIPVFHDDQHGTAVVACAGLLNALRLTGKKRDKIRTVICGAGAAGIAIGKMLIQMGFGNIVMVGSRGALYEGNPHNNPEQERLAALTNREGRRGNLIDVIKGADVFIGVSKSGLLTAEMVKSMKTDPIIFAMANPVPEIMPDVAKEAGAAVVGTGRSDFPNQVNNVLAFPGIFRGALDAGARTISLSMQEAACKALAGVISDQELTADYVLPDVFDKRVVRAVSGAIKEEVRGTFPQR